MSRENPRILLAGGGTGGHLFPALAIADEIRKLNPRAEFLFVGTSGKIEARVVPERGYAFATIWISGFHRSLTAANLLFPLKVAVSMVQSFFLMRRFAPDIVVGTGGYVCGPVLRVASFHGVPTVLHESNSYPGVTTRLSARQATKVFTAFDITSRWLPPGTTVDVVGTPTRDSLGTVSRVEAAKFFGIEAGKKTLLVFGGSLGAASINDAVLELVDDLDARGVQLIWQTGEKDFERIKNLVGQRKIDWIGPFLDKIEYAYSAADLAVCRAGAITVAELARIGKPAILIPYPGAAADHQTYNAQSMVDAGAAKMITDWDVGNQLGKEILGILNDAAKLNSMHNAGLKVARPGAGKMIAQKILELIR